MRPLVRRIAHPCRTGRGLCCAVGVKRGFALISQGSGSRRLVDISSVLGACVWFSDRVGLDLGVDHRLVFDRGEPVHELLFA